MDVRSGTSHAPDLYISGSGRSDRSLRCGWRDKSIPSRYFLTLEGSGAPPRAPRSEKCRYRAKALGEAFGFYNTDGLVLLVEGGIRCTAFYPRGSEFRSLSFADYGEQVY